MRFKTIHIGCISKEKRSARGNNTLTCAIFSQVAFTRELDLAHAFLAAGAVEHPKRDPDSVLGKLASVPCDVVPLAKLLLHADAFLGDPKYATQVRNGGPSLA